MACEYTYQGDTYSREDLLMLLRGGILNESVKMTNARKWLKDKLGMTDEQIITVSGLIDDEAFGRLIGDGNILLSDRMETGTEYHEAFHRVYRFMITEKERAEILKEIKADKTIDLSEMRELYPDATINELYEEYMAEEFRDYVMHRGNYNTTPKAKSALTKMSAGAVIVGF